MARNKIIRAARNNIFNRVPRIGPKKNVFPRPHQHITTFKMGWCVPFLCEETLPGDTWRLSHEIQMRFLPLYFPIMSQIDIRVDYFYVTNTTLWPVTLNDKGFEDFIQDEGDLTWPYQDLSTGAQSGTITNIQEDSVLCYLGIPTTELVGVTDPQHISALKVAAYAKIWDFYYRSDHLQDEIWQVLIEGENVWCNDVGFALPQKAAWAHDYFTSALPQPVEGSDVLIPLLKDPPDYPNDGLKMVNAASGGATGAVTDVEIDNGFLQKSGTGTELGVDVGNFNEQADTIRKLRLHVMLQEFWERANRIGGKFRNFVAGRWGVDPRPGDIDEAVYIGSSRGRVVISDVMQTAETTNDTDGTVTSPVGQYSGQALALQSSNTFQYSCQEWGWIMGIVVVRPRPGYFQGVERSWFRETYMDYPFPEFAHIGDQAIMNKEIYWDWTDNNPTLHDAAFGYVPRYSEWRWKNDTVSGKMRTQFANWHLHQKYDTRPTLNSDFIACTPRADDVFVMSDNSEHEIFANIYCDNSVSRGLPRFGTPAL